MFWVNCYKGNCLASRIFLAIVAWLSGNLTSSELASRASYWIRDWFPGLVTADYVSECNFILPGHSLSICTCKLSIYIFSFSFFFFLWGRGGFAHGMWTFLDQGWKPRHSSYQSHSNDNGRSLTLWTTRELPVIYFLWEIWRKDLVSFFS